MSALTYEQQAGPSELTPSQREWFEYLLSLRSHGPRARVKPRVVRVASPAAGAEWSLSVEPGVVWLPLSVFYFFVTSAAVANRTSALKLTDSMNEIARFGPPAVITAGLNGRYTYARDAPVGGSFTASAFVGPLGQIPLPGGFTIGTTTINIDAGDQYSSISVYLLESWPETVGEAIARAERAYGGQQDEHWSTLLEGL